MVSLVEVEGIACEDHFGDLSSGSSHLAGVLLGLSAIEDWRIKCVRNVVQSLRIGLDCWG